MDGGLGPGEFDLIVHGRLGLGAGGGGGGGWHDSQRERKREFWKIKVGT